jgi:hypothetical protein
MVEMVAGFLTADVLTAGVLTADVLTADVLTAGVVTAGVLPCYLTRMVLTAGTWVVLLRAETVDSNIRYLHDYDS